LVAVERCVCDLLSRGEEVTLTALGGELAVLRDAPAIVQSPILDEVVHACCAAWSEVEDTVRVSNLIVDGLGAVQHPAALSDALDALLAFPSVAQRVGPAASARLIERARVRTDVRASDLAGRALEGALRLALATGGSRYSVLAELASVSESEDPLFAVRVTRLLGVAYEQWPDAELTRALETLLEIPEAAADASFELGMCHLFDALESWTAEDVRTGLRVARGWLARAEHADEERADAAIIGGVLDVVLGFSGGGAPDSLRAQVEKAQHVSRLRRGWLFGMREGWLSPRADAEVEWLLLASLLARAAANLKRPSWKEPHGTLQQTLEAYVASRAIRPAGERLAEGNGLATLVQPKIEAAFIRQAGLRQHLLDWLDELEEPQRAVGTRLLERLEHAVPEEAAPSDLRWPLISRMIDLEGVDVSDGARVLDLWERRQADASAARVHDADPLLDQLFTDISKCLLPCPDYRGEIHVEFDALVRLTLKFLRSRQDTQPSSYSRRMAYLFARRKGENPPLERELADDYHEFLSGNNLGGALHSEVRDIGGGRVDVLVEYGTHHFVAELKREFTDASPTALREYLGQAASYQGTNVTLGILLVLDLTPKQRAPHVRSNAWVEIVPAMAGGDLQRYVVVVRVPGNRPVPSEAGNPFPVGHCEE
jgi:hypothetical protein